MKVFPLLFALSPTAIKNEKKNKKQSSVTCPVCFWQRFSSCIPDSRTISFFLFCLKSKGKKIVKICRWATKRAPRKFGCNSEPFCALTVISKINSSWKLLIYDVWLDEAGKDCSGTNTVPAPPKNVHFLASDIRSQSLLMLFMGQPTANISWHLDGLFVWPHSCYLMFPACWPWSAVHMHPILYQTKTSPLVRVDRSEWVELCCCEAQVGELWALYRVDKSNVFRKHSIWCTRLESTRNFW